MTPDAEVARWLDGFGAALGAGDVPRAAAMFEPGGFWRDLLAFTWNIRTIEGREAIAAELAATLPAARPSGWRALAPAEAPGPGEAEAWIAFDTAQALCRGRLRLRDGRARVLLTAIDDLRGHEEPRGPARPPGVRHGARRDRETWAEARAARRAALGRTLQPEVLIIGGGQGGLALGARLAALSVPYLIVERNPRAGDSWRNRYRTLVLHDPVWYDHMPYIPFPETWPVFTPKDRMGDWLEAYALALDLDLWTSATVLAARRDAVRGRWEVTVDRNGETVVLTPRELVFATGAYGPPRPVDWPGAAEFRGTILHSSAWASAEGWGGRRAVVVGAASSAHDIAQDLWEAGAEVTMVQRSPTCVVRSDTLMELGFAAYSEASVARGIGHETADWLGAATPYALLAEEQRGLYAEIRRRDAEFYRRLEGAGFALDFGPGGAGLFMKALSTASGYYIDVGGSDLIARGEVRVVSGRGVRAVAPRALVLEDGTELPADLVVACTGYRSMHETVAAIVSREAADAVGPCWGLGSGLPGDPGPWQGELRNMWKPTAVEGLWFHGGNLALSRFYSRILALQLKARAAGLPTPVWGRPVPLNA
jgi:putative flavoprotein involved in K+ transport